MPSPAKKTSWFEAPLNRARRFIGVPRANVERRLNQAVSKILPSKHGPELMARGGEHLVLDFEDPKHSDLIYKVNFHESLPLLKAVQQGGPEKERALQVMLEEMDRRRKELNRLRRYVGFSAVPVQQAMIREIPVTTAVVRALKLPDEVIGPNFPETVPAWIVLQRKVELGRDDISLNAYYPEASFYPPSQGQEAGHRLLVGDEGGDSNRDVQLDAMLSLYPDFRFLNGYAMRDPGLRSALREATEQMIGYVRETGTALDLVGKNNVVLRKTVNGWDLKMLDPMSMGDARIRDLEKAIRAFRDREETEVDWEKVMNALNTVRVLNALALISGSSERLRVPGLETVSAEYFQRKIKPLFRYAEED